MKTLHPATRAARRGLALLLLGALILLAAVLAAVALAPTPPQ